MSLSFKQIISFQVGDDLAERRTPVRDRYLREGFRDCGVDLVGRRPAIELPPDERRSRCEHRRGSVGRASDDHFTAHPANRNRCVTDRLGRQ
jgi:hypothetical protein